MRRIYNEKTIPIYLNDSAKSILKEGIDNYHALNLDRKDVILIGNTIHVLTWLGDQVANTITVLLQMHGLMAECYGGIIDIRNCSLDEFYRATGDILSRPKISTENLAGLIPNTITAKHDPILPKNLRDIGYGARSFDIDGASRWLSII